MGMYGFVKITKLSQCRSNVKWYNEIYICGGLFKICNIADFAKFLTAGMLEIVFHNPIENKKFE